MSSVWLDGDLDSSGVGIGVVQIPHVICTLTVTSTDIKVEFWQHVLDWGFEVGSLEAYNVIGRGEFTNRDWLLDFIAVVEHLLGERDFGVAGEENGLDTGLLAHNIPAWSVIKRVMRIWRERTSCQPFRDAHSEWSL